MVYDKILHVVVKKWYSIKRSTPAPIIAGLKIEFIFGCYIYLSG